MKKIALTVASLVSGIVFSQKTISNLEKYENENTLVLHQKKSIEFIFMGDSITEFWKEKNPQFFENFNMLDRGISGQTSSQMLLRFQQDVINLRPKKVFILAGTNDIAENLEQISLPQILDNIKSMTDLARFHHIKVALCSVLPAYDFGWKKNLKPAEKIMILNKMIKDYAKENHLEFVDFHTEMKDEREGLKAIYTQDEVHPNLDGYKKMEEIVSPFLKSK